VTTPLFSPGFDGVVAVREVGWKDTKLGALFLVNLEVVESNLTEHPPGWLGLWFVKLFDIDIARALLSDWLAACKGCDRGVFLGMPTFLQLLGEAATKKGARLRLKTELVTAKSGRTFTWYDFSPLLVLVDRRSP
jgi:hypothetical protein